MGRALPGELVKYLHRRELGQLGDFICVEGDCKQGEAQLAQLQAFAASLGPTHGDVVDHFQPAIDSLVKSFTDAESSVGRHFPFSTACCEIKAIGVQAQQLQAQLAAGAGVAGPPEIKAPSSTLDKLATLATVAGVGLLLWKLYDKHIAPTRRK